MIPCEKCGASLSEQAAACPQCGHPRARPALFKRLFTVAAVLTGLVAAISAQRAFAAAYTAHETDLADTSFDELNSDRSKCVEQVSGVLMSDPCWAAADHADRLRVEARALATQRTICFTVTGVFAAIAAAFLLVWRSRVKQERLQRWLSE